MLRMSHDSNVFCNTDLQINFHIIFPPYFLMTLCLPGTESQPMPINENTCTTYIKINKLYYKHSLMIQIC